MKIISMYHADNRQAALLSELSDSMPQADLAGYSWDQDIFAEAPAGDVLHIHDTASILAAWQGLTEWMEKQRPVPLVQYANEELRTRKEAERANPYAHDDQYEDDKVAFSLGRIAQHFPACIVNHAEAVHYAKKYHKRIYILPQAVPLNGATDDADLVPAAKQELFIVHVKTGDASGSDYAARAVALLKKNKTAIHYECLENASGPELIDKLQQADIVIDQLLHGSYSEAAVLAMGLGKPVLSHLRADLLERLHPDLPIISANPATIYRGLLTMLEDPQLRGRLGARGKAFYNKHHHPDAVRGQLLWIYENEPKQSRSPLKSNDNEIVIFDRFTGKVYSERSEPQAPDLLPQPIQEAGEAELAATAAVSAPHPDKNKNKTQSTKKGHKRYKRRRSIEDQLKARRRQYAKQLSRLSREKRRRLHNKAAKKKGPQRPRP